VLTDPIPVGSALLNYNFEDLSVFHIVGVVI
jgi:hypothetical protein